MTVSPFRLDDLGCFTPNEFSEPAQVLPILSGRDGWDAQTIWAADYKVAAIGAYRKYWGACWEGFFLISKEFEPKYAAQLRNLIQSHLVVNRVQRLQTESVAHEKLREWHKFLGFTLEGTKRKFMFNRDYDSYAIVRETP